MQGQAIISGGNLEHDFGTASLTDLLIDIFEDELLQKLQTNGEQAVADAIAELNLRLDGLDANGNPVSGQNVQFVATGSNNTLTQPAAVTNAAGQGMGGDIYQLAKAKGGILKQVALLPNDKLGQDLPGIDIACSVYFNDGVAAHDMVADFEKDLQVTVMFLGQT